VCVIVPQFLLCSDLLTNCRVAGKFFRTRTFFLQPLTVLHQSFRDDAFVSRTCKDDLKSYSGPKIALRHGVSKDELCCGGRSMNSRFTDDSMNWRKLCRAAALEQNPDKLSQIIHRINSALKTHQRRLRSFLETRRNRTSHIPSRLDRAA
jgi:hypothetical protein